MPLLPRLVGGIEVRERNPRYEGEPRRKRLEFIRPKTTTNSDDWSLIRTSYPRPQAPQYGAPWDHPQWNSLPYHQQRQLLAQYGYQPPEHMLHGHHGHNDIPAPPLHGDYRPLSFDERRQIAGPHSPELPDGIVKLHSDDDDSEDDREVVKIIKPSKKKHHDKRGHPAGHSIFGSDSEDDRRSRHRHSAGSTITIISSEGSSISRHGNRRGHRGWGG